MCDVMMICKITEDDHTNDHHHYLRYIVTVIFYNVHLISRAALEALRLSQQTLPVLQHLQFKLCHVSSNSVTSKSAHVLSTKIEGLRILNVSPIVWSV